MRDPYRKNMRRMRRAMRKGGQDNPYGVIIVGPDEPFGLTALSALGKWAYRHRSAFAPFAVALAAAVAADVLHAHAAAWWPAAVAATMTVTVLLGVPHSLLSHRPAGVRAARFLARLWKLCGINRAAERAYAAAVAGCGGGWLSAAVAVGPGRKPLPVLAVVLTLALGVPWWLHRRRRAKVRVEATVDAWDGIADEIGLSGSRIASVTVDAWGWTARVILKRGTTTATAIAKIPEIESGIGARPGSVRMVPDPGQARVLSMRVTEADPHSATVPWPGTEAGGTIARPVPVGLSGEGRTVAVTLLRRNALLGGTTGAGKSGVLNVIIAALAACRDVVLWGVDLKGGMELRPWAACFGRLATTPEEASALFRDAVGVLNQRARAKAASGERVHDPSPRDPALIIIVDEYAELSDESVDCADSVARRGRAVAVTLVAATQKPTQAAMGKDTAVRSMMDTRICLRVRERRDVDLVLGQGSFAGGWHAHQLTRPGEFLIADPEHAAPDKNRAYLITDGQVAQHAAACAPARPDLPDESSEAAPDAPDHRQDTRAALVPADDGNGPEAALWDALRAAGPEGASVASLSAACGMGRRWVYYRLGELADAGSAVQAARGKWRAAVPGDGPAESEL